MLYHVSRYKSKPKQTENGEVEEVLTICGKRIQTDRPLTRNSMVTTESPQACDGNAHCGKCFASGNVHLAVNEPMPEWMSYEPKDTPLFDENHRPLGAAYTDIVPVKRQKHRGWVTLTPKNEHAITPLIDDLDEKPRARKMKKMIFTKHKRPKPAGI